MYPLYISVSASASSRIQRSKCTMRDFFLITEYFVGVYRFREFVDNRPVQRIITHWSPQPSLSQTEILYHNNEVSDAKNIDTLIGFCPCVVYMFRFSVSDYKQSAECQINDRRKFHHTTHHAVAAVQVRVDSMNT